VCALTVEATSDPEPGGVACKLFTGIKQRHVDNPALGRAVCSAVFDADRPDGPYREFLFDKCGGKVLREKATTCPVAASQAQVAIAHTLRLTLHATIDLVGEVDGGLREPNLARIHAHGELAPVARGCKDWCAGGRYAGLC